MARRLVTVEDLGSCAFIAADKTDTLTMNELTVRKFVGMLDPLRPAVEPSILACQRGGIQVIVLSEPSLHDEEDEAWRRREWSRPPNTGLCSSLPPTDSDGHPRLLNPVDPRSARWHDPHMKRGAAYESKASCRA